MFNKVILMGRLVADPELRQTPSNISVCRFRIAVDRGYQSNSGERQADFISIVAWRQSAEFVSKYFSKVAQSCPTLCDPMDFSTPGCPLQHHLLELAQTHVH